MRPHKYYRNCLLRHSPRQLWHYVKPLHATIGFRYIVIAFQVKVWLCDFGKNYSADVLSDFEHEQEIAE